MRQGPTGLDEYNMIDVQYSPSDCVAIQYYGIYSMVDLYTLYSVAGLYRAYRMCSSCAAYLICTALCPLFHDCTEGDLSVTP